MLLFLRDVNPQIDSRSYRSRLTAVNAGPNRRYPEQKAVRVRLCSAVPQSVRAKRWPADLQSSRDSALLTPHDTLPNLIGLPSGGQRTPGARSLQLCFDQARTNPLAEYLVLELCEH